MFDFVVYVMRLIMTRKKKEFALNLVGHVKFDVGDRQCHGDSRLGQ